jgi:peptidyl-tRNA hydrolase, PTH2 family
MSASLKQVICVRKDLNMRKGKMVSQGCHASLMAYLSACGNRDNMSVVYDWLQNYKQTKVCVGIESEEQLFEVHRKAQAAGIPCSLVLDAAVTEFETPTYTACAIGPAPSEHIDTITGTLKLL